MPMMLFAPPAVAVLTGRELLSLQLLARGYTPGQVALLTGTDDRAVSDALAGAVSALNANDVTHAVAIARHQKLIL